VVVKLDIGDRCVVVGKSSGHMFEIGEEVVVVKVDKLSIKTIYLFESLTLGRTDQRWWLNSSDVIIKKFRIDNKML
tara:strand:+ start:471 stop:698 length:228 start_codon:yes stop_codon:yes gene_type:complete